MVLLVNYQGSNPITASPDGKWNYLRASESVSLYKDEYRKIPLGVSLIIPEGYEVHIAPRKSTFEKWGIILPCGILVIDTSKDTNIPWEVPVLAMRDTVIYEGDRIVQFRLVPKQPDYYIISYN